MFEFPELQSVMSLLEKESRDDDYGDDVGFRRPDTPEVQTAIWPMQRPKLGAASSSISEKRPSFGGIIHERDIAVDVRHTFRRQGEPEIRNIQTLYGPGGAPPVRLPQEHYSVSNMRGLPVRSAFQDFPHQPIRRDPTLPRDWFDHSLEEEGHIYPDDIDELRSRHKDWSRYAVEGRNSQGIPVEDVLDQRERVAFDEARQMSKRATRVLGRETSPDPSPYIQNLLPLRSPTSPTFSPTPPPARAPPPPPLSGLSARMPCALTSSSRVIEPVGRTRAEYPLSVSKAFRGGGDHVPTLHRDLPYSASSSSSFSDTLPPLSASQSSPPSSSSTRRHYSESRELSSPQDTLPSLDTAHHSQLAPVRTQLSIRKRQTQKSPSKDPYHAAASMSRQGSSMASPQSDLESHRVPECDSNPEAPAPQSGSRSSSEAKDSKRRHGCPIPGCDKTFTRKNDVQRHLKSSSAHRNLEQISTDSLTRCKYCGRILSRNDSARRHELESACGKRTLKSEREVQMKGGALGEDGSTTFEDDEES